MSTTPSCAPSCCRWPPVVVLPAAGPEEEGVCALFAALRCGVSGAKRGFVADFDVNLSTILLNSMDSRRSLSRASSRDLGVAVLCGWDCGLGESPKRVVWRCCGCCLLPGVDASLRFNGAVLAACSTTTNELLRRVVCDCAVLGEHRTCGDEKAFMHLLGSLLLMLVFDPLFLLLLVLGFFSLSPAASARDAFFTGRIMKSSSSSSSFRSSSMISIGTVVAVGGGDGATANDATLELLLSAGAVCESFFGVLTLFLLPGGLPRRGDFVLAIFVALCDSCVAGSLLLLPLFGLRVNIGAGGGRGGGDGCDDCDGCDKGSEGVSSECNLGVLGGDGSFVESVWCGPKKLVVAVAVVGVPFVFFFCLVFLGDRCGCGGEYGVAGFRSRNE